MPFVDPDIQMRLRSSSEHPDRGYLELYNHRLGELCKPTGVLLPADVVVPIMVGERISDAVL